MVNIDSFLSNQFIKATELNGQTIAKIINEGQFVDSNFGGLQFVVEIEINNETRRLRLNKTNLKILREQFGRNTQEWIGKTIALQTKDVMVRNQLVKSIAVTTIEEKVGE